MGKRGLDFIDSFWGIIYAVSIVAEFMEGINKLAIPAATLKDSSCIFRGNEFFGCVYYEPIIEAVFDNFLEVIYIPLTVPITWRSFLLYEYDSISLGVKIFFHTVR